MINLGKILSETVWKVKLELHEQILEKLYEQRSVTEYVTLTEVFDYVSFELLYKNVAMLQQSKLIEFYTAPEAYAVFQEPDFIKAKIRLEGIQYWTDHCSFLRKYKTSAGIVLGVLSLILCSFLLHLTVNKDRNVFSENSATPPSQSGSSSDSLAAKSNSPTTMPPLLTSENHANPKKIMNDSVKLKSQSKKEVKTGGTKKEGTADQIAAVDTKHNYTIELDTLNHLVKVSPKSGNWDSTVLAIPFSEMEFVQPKFQSQSKIWDGADFVFDALGLRFSGVVSTRTSKGEDTYFTLHYLNKPTVFLFGGYPNRLYPYYFTRGADK